MPNAASTTKIKFLGDNCKQYCNEGEQLQFEISKDFNFEVSNIGDSSAFLESRRKVGIKDFLLFGSLL